MNKGVFHWKRQALLLASLLLVLMCALVGRAAVPPNSNATPVTSVSPTWSPWLNGFDFPVRATQSSVVETPAANPLTVAPIDTSLQPSPEAPRQVSVPSVVGMTQEQALATLRGAGFYLVKPTYEPIFSETVPKGYVISQDYYQDAMGGWFCVGLTISWGSEFVPVVNVIGMKEANAIAALRNAGCEAGIIYELHTNSGTVIDQSPKPPATVKCASSKSNPGIVWLTIDGKFPSLPPGM